MKHSKYTYRYILFISIFTIHLMPGAINQVKSKPRQVEEQPAALGDFDFPGNRLVLKTTHSGPHPKVVVDLGDGETYHFIVDTGASVNVMDTTIAEKLGYNVIGSTEIGAPGGPQVAMDIVKVPLAKIDAGEITDAEFLLMDIQKFSMGTMHGVIGMGLFREYLLTFDMGEGLITISRESLSIDDPTVITYQPSNGHIMIEMDVAGTPVDAHIDTGAMGGFMLPGESLQSFPIMGEPQAGRKARLVGGERDITRAQINGSIRFGGFEFKNETVSFMTPSTGYGNIGGDVFSQMVMPIDQKNHLIGFRKPTKKTGTLTGKPRRLGVEFRGMGGGGDLAIGMIEKGSLGESAGFQSGDKMVSVNGRSIKDVAIQELGALIQGKELLEFVVERKGQLTHITVK